MSCHYGQLSTVLREAVEIERARVLPVSAGLIAVVTEEGNYQDGCEWHRHYRGVKGSGRGEGLLCPQHASEPRAGKGPLHWPCASAQPPFLSARGCFPVTPLGSVAWLPACMLSREPSKPHFDQPEASPQPCPDLVCLFKVRFSSCSWGCLSPTPAVFLEDRSVGS